MGAPPQGQEDRPLAYWINSVAQRRRASSLRPATVWMDAALVGDRDPTNQNQGPHTTGLSSFQLSINILLSHRAAGYQHVQAQKKVGGLHHGGSHVPFRQSSFVKKLIDHTNAVQVPRGPRLRLVGYGACPVPSDRGKVRATTSCAAGSNFGDHRPEDCVQSWPGVARTQRFNSLVGPV